MTKKWTCFHLHKRVLVAWYLTDNFDQYGYGVTLTGAAGVISGAMGAIGTADDVGSFKYIAEVVTDDANKVKEVINLKKEQVKGNKTDRIFVSDKLKKEILSYIASTE